MLSMTVNEMVGSMIEETNCRAELNGVRANLWRSQFKDAFKYPGGPEEYWSDVERQWKEATDGAPIPAKYRSNKSVILKAHATDSNVLVWTVHGKVKGKSAIEKMMKETADPTDAARIIRIIEAAYKQHGAAYVEVIMEDVVTAVKNDYGVLL